MILKQNWREPWGRLPLVTSQLLAGRFPKWKCEPKCSYGVLYVFVCACYYENLHMLSNLGSATSNAHFQESSLSVIHLHTSTTGRRPWKPRGHQVHPEEADTSPEAEEDISINCCSSRQRLFTVLENKHVFGHPMKNDIVASRRMISRYRAPCNPSQVWLITVGRGLTSTANIWNAWIRCFWEITLYNFTQRQRKLPRLLGTCWPRKLISVLAKLDCTLIWMWSTASRGILFCHRLKTPGQSNKAGSIGT